MRALPVLFFVGLLGFARPGPPAEPITRTVYVTVTNDNWRPGYRPHFG